MLTCEIRVNGRLVGLVEIVNDGAEHEATRDYDVEVHDFARKTQSEGRVTDFDRERGALDLVREALDAAS